VTAIVTAKNIGPHVAVLILSSAIAWRAFSHKPEVLPTGGAEVWSGNAADVSRLEFQNDKKHVVFTVASDAQGRYAVASVDKSSAPSAASVVKPGLGDAGAPGSSGSNAPEAAAKEPAVKETATFVAGKDFADLVEKLAKLRATRDLGKVATNQLAEYGLEREKLPVLRLQQGTTQRELVVGGSTPGGSDIYVATPDKSRVFVVPGNLVHDLESAESRLMERNLHTFDDQDVARVSVKSGQQSRELVRSTETGSFWTDVGNAAGKDETASNWMKNLQRLRVNEYVSAEVEAKALFSVSYLDKLGKNLGRLEFAVRPKKSEAGPLQVASGPEKLEYLVRSEQTRWWGKVLTSAGEPLAQDLASVVK
jgi:hypothetical protein